MSANSSLTSVTVTRMANHYVIKNHSSHQSVKLPQIKPFRLRGDLSSFHPPSCIFPAQRLSFMSTNIRKAEGLLRNLPQKGEIMYVACLISLYLLVRLTS